MDQELYAKAFASWLSAKMKERGFRFAADLARASDVSPQTISGWLHPRPSPNTGKYQSPRREMVLKLYRVLGVTKEEILEAAGFSAIRQAPPIENDLSPVAKLFYEFQDLDDKDKAELEASVEMFRAEIRRRKAQPKE